MDKRLLIVSGILLAFSVGLIVLGVLLFPTLPNVEVELFTAKDGLKTVGLIFCFIFAFVSFMAGIAILIYNFTEDR